MKCWKCRGGQDNARLNPLQEVGVMKSEKLAGNPKLPSLNPLQEVGVMKSLSIFLTQLVRVLIPFRKSG